MIRKNSICLISEESLNDDERQEHFIENLDETDFDIFDSDDYVSPNAFNDFLTASLFISRLDRGSDQRRQVYC